MNLIHNLYGLRKKQAKDAQVNKLGDTAKQILKGFLGETTKAGDVVIDKPATASKRILVMLLYAILVIVNSKYDLGLTPEELTTLAALVGTYVTFKSIEDAWKRSAAIAKHMKPEPVKPGEKVPGLDRDA